MLGMMALVGFFLPPLIGLVNRKLTDSDARFWVSFLVCVIVGAGMNFLERNGIYAGLTMIDIANTLADSILVMTGIVKLSFESIWNNKAVGKLVEQESLLKTLDLK